MLKPEVFMNQGTCLISESGIKYEVVKLLGSGGQGEVYDVKTGAKHYALKWYHREKATPAQKKILKGLIEKGNPGQEFAWPEDMITADEGRRFGYIMKLRPAEYKNPVALMKNKINPSFYTICRIAYNTTLAFQKLHKMGYCYSDISFGNLFFDPVKGDVLICDNDNVSVSGLYESQVLGTPGFMAPEVVTGKAKPARNTDLYSLAVLLFYLFFVNHPLDGAHEAQIRCMDMAARIRLYGTNPVFIYDPLNKDNRPVPGRHDNAIIYWDIFPESIKALFTESFTVGLTDPRKRVTENTWLQSLADLMTGIVHCPSCKAEVFENGTPSSKCWNCGGDVKMPAKMVIGKSRVLITSNAKLYSRHTNGDSDMDTVTGEITVNPNDPTVWGVRNLTQGNWTYTNPDGTQVAVAPGRAARIVPGARIDFARDTLYFA